MKKNLSDLVASKKTAQSRVYSIIGTSLNGFFRDSSWESVNQLFRSLRAVGGEVEVEKAEYFAVNGVSAMGKRWNLNVTANGFTFPAILTASFADKPNGDVYDLTFTV